MKETMQRYEDAAEGPNKAHFRSIGQHSQYWKNVLPKRTCLACLEAGNPIFLPCNHILCETCYRKQGSSATQLSYCGPIPCRICTFCKAQWDRFEVILPPPTAGARVLSLDGGGIKGIVELLTLQHLDQIINLPIPFHYFFDQMLGTSIGDHYLISSSPTHLHRLITNY